MDQRDEANSVSISKGLSDPSSSSEEGKKSGAAKSEESATASTVYRDFSKVQPTDVGFSAQLGTSASKEPSFPHKLWMILNNPDFKDIITWLPHGRSWHILKHKEFENTVIPLYFRHKRYSSFTRQVNGWGFKRVLHGADFNSYYHELFLRGMPHLCDRMKRLTAQDMKQRKTEEAGPTPNFYALTRDHPLPEAVPNVVVDPDLVRPTLRQQPESAYQSVPSSSAASYPQQSAPVQGQDQPIGDIYSLVAHVIGANPQIMSHLSLPGYLQTSSQQHGNMNTTQPRNQLSIFAQQSGQGMMGSLALGSQNFSSSRVPSPQRSPGAPLAVSVPPLSSFGTNNQLAALAAQFLQRHQSPPPTPATPQPTSLDNDTLCAIVSTAQQLLDHLKGAGPAQQVFPGSVVTSEDKVQAEDRLSSVSETEQSHPRSSLAARTPGNITRGVSQGIDSIPSVITGLVGGGAPMVPPTGQSPEDMLHLLDSILNQNTHLREALQTNGVLDAIVRSLSSGGS